MKQYNYDCYEDNYIYVINVGRNAKENWNLIDMSKHIIKHSILIKTL